jgi:hypothetical protein
MAMMNEQQQKQFATFKIVMKINDESSFCGSQKNKQ